MGKWLVLALAAGGTVAAQVKIAGEGGRVTVEIDGKPFTTLYTGGQDAPKPYLHPLRSASGRVVTRLYPMEKVEGERRDHPHHRGLWFAHGEVNGVDFWTNEASEPGTNKGRIVLSAVRLKSGKKSGTIKAVFDWQGPQGASVLRETRTMVFYADPRFRTIDFTIDLKPAGGKVTFGDTKEGTFAIRVAPSLEEESKGAPALPKRTGQLSNADGLEGEKAAWGKRSNWVDCSGEVDGERLGISILDHPGNVHHPGWWHARGYGLLAANPFGQHDFESDKSKDASVTVEPGRTLRLRYRVVIHPGDARSADIAGMWERYTRRK